jgi:hypothetical protein
MIKFLIERNSTKYKLIKKLFKSGETKRSSRPLETVQKIERRGPKWFVIWFKEGNKDKPIIYECHTMDECSEILAKFEYLGKVIVEKDY